MTAGALPAGITLAANGTLAGTPSAGGSFAFTITATDATAAGSGGPYSASRSYTLGVAAPIVSLAPATLPAGAAGTAYSQALSASGGTAPYSYAVTAGTLPGGLTLAAGGTLAGTPTQSGSFTFTVTATDASTGSGPYAGARSYTLAISAPATPVVGNVAITVAYGSSGNVINPALSGGQATSIAVVTAPTHGTVQINALTFVYTPAAGYAGADGFTYTASNTGGASQPASVAVTVSAPAVAITTTTLPNPQQGVAYSQQIAASGGAAPYAFAVAAGALPTGLTLSTVGLVSGTPTTSGGANFTITATDGSTGAGPFTASQAYSITVALPAPPVIRPVPTTTAAGSSATSSTPTQIVLSDYVTGSYTDIQVSTQPTNGAVVVTQSGARIVASYTPRANYAGPDSFAFVAVGPGGQSASATVQLTVTGVAPVVAPLTASVVQGTPATVSLTAAASGGPFTAAAITGILPANAVTAVLVEGGSAGNRTYGLTITPALTFSGTAVVTYTVSNQFGASAPASVTVSVAARPDPSLDDAVNAIAAAQNDATRRFATAQIDNFARRTEQLHHGGGDSQGSPFGVAVSVGMPFNLGGGVAAGYPGEDDLLNSKNEHVGAVEGAERAAGLLTTRSRQDGGFAVGNSRSLVATDVRSNARNPRGDKADSANGIAGGVAEDRRGVGPTSGGDEARDEHSGSERNVGSLALWSGGAIAVGTRDATTQRVKLSVTTGGLSAGADIKLADNLIVGAGGGYGADTTRIDGGRSQVKGDSWSVAGYGSWSPTGNLFIDGLFGGGALSFDTRRLVPDNGAIATASRDGSLLFGSLSAGLDKQGGAVIVSAYGRVDWMRARLDAYRETGGGNYNLSYAQRDLDSLSSVLGARISIPMDGWMPRVRGEWRHEFNDASSQLLDYADLSSFRYATRGDQWLRDAFSLDIGVDVKLGRGWLLGTDLGAGAGSGTRFGTAKLSISKEF